MRAKSEDPARRRTKDALHYRRASSEADRVIKRSSRSPAMLPNEPISSGKTSKLNIKEEPPETQQFLVWRQFMQNYAKAVQKDVPPPNKCSDSDIRKILDRLAITNYNSHAWQRSKIRKCLPIIYTVAINKYPPTAKMAQELDLRLEAEDAVPGPLQSSLHEDEIEDSGSDEDSGDEEDVIDDDDDDAAGSLIMENIERSGISWKIRDPSKKRNAKVFGHNGIKPGQWWPMQICALRDGAHGSRMAGISGTGDDGCYSVVVAGGKSTVHGHDDYKDVDNFDDLWYSGTVSHDAADRDAAVPPMTSSTKALMASVNSYRRHGENTKGVRVLRGKGASRYAPPVGLRYDGLYWVTNYEVVGNANNGYYRFRLVRQPGQPSYKELSKRPDAYERNWYDNRDKRTR